MTQKPLLRAERIDKRYGAVHSLRGVDFEIHPGEVVALLGENGAGKSTFVKILSGLVAADSGQIVIDGELVDITSSAKSQAAGIAVVQQEYSTVPVLTVAENLYLGKVDAPFIWSRRRLHAHATRLLAAVGLEGLDPDTPVGALSVAEMQLIEVARVLADNARLVIFDEPTAALSETEAQRVLDAVRRLSAKGIAVIYVTHRLPEVFAIADRIAVFRNGSSLPSIARTEIDVHGVIAMMLGRELTSMFPERPTQFGADRLLLNDVRVEGLAGPVSLTARRGEILGITGQLGSGADLVVKAIAAERLVIEGTIVIDDAPFRAETRARGLAAGVTYCSPDRKRDGIFFGIPISTNLSSSWLDKISTGGFLRPAAERQLTTAAATAFSVDVARLGSPVGQLSGGNQQKVVLAKWLGNQPRIFLVEEPTRGVDVGARSDIYTKLRRLCDEGMTVVVSSSDTAEVLGLCDTIATFYHGALVAVKPAVEWTEESLAAAVLNGTT